MEVSLCRPSQANPTKLVLSDEPVEAIDLVPVYLGESLEAILTIPLHSCAIVQRIELQTGTSRSVLFEGIMPGPSISLRWEVKDVGVHLLAIRANEKSFFLRYPVGNPLSLKTKLTELANGCLLVEAELANLVEEEVILDRFTLLRTEQSGRVERVEGEGWLETTAGYLNEALPPGTTKQLVFRLPNLASLPGTRLDLQWHAGHRHGQLQTLPLRMPAGSRPVLSLFWWQTMDGILHLTLRNNEQVTVRAISLQASKPEPWRWQVGELSEGEEVHQVKEIVCESGRLMVTGPWWLTFELGGVVHRIPHELPLFGFGNKKAQGELNEEAGLPCLN